MLLFLDGFDNYSAEGDLSQRWTYNTSTGDFLSTGGKFGGGAVSNQAGGATNLAVTSIGSQAAGTTLHVAGLIKPTTTLPAANDVLFSWLDIGSNGVSIRFTTNQRIFARDWNGANIVATEAGASGYLSTKLDQWVHFECRYVIHNSAIGQVRVWLDGNLILSYDGTMGASSGAIDRAAFGGASGRPIVWDDVVLWNGAGSEFNYAQLGVAPGAFEAHKITTLRPTANGATNNYTPLAGGTNYQNVDDAPFHDGSTSYNNSITNGHIDLYQHGTSFDQATASVLGIQHLMYVSSAFGSVTLNGVARIGGVNYDDDASLTINTSPSLFAPRIAFWPVNPADSAEWDEADINAAQFGLKRTAGTVDMRITQSVLEVLTAGAVPAQALELAASFADEATLDANILISAIIDLAATFTDEATLVANIEAKSPLLLAASFTDDAILVANIVTELIEILLAASFTDEAVGSATLSDAIERPPPVQCVVVVS